MPVAAEVDRLEWDHDEVGGAGLDVLVAARAAIALPRLVGLDEPDLGDEAGARVDRALGCRARHRRRPLASCHSPG